MHCIDNWCYYSNKSSDDSAYDKSCPFVHCVSCDAVVMDGNGRGNMTSHDIKNHLPLLAGAHVIHPFNSSNDGLVYYIRLSNEQQGVLYHVSCIDVC